MAMAYQIGKQEILPCLIRAPRAIGGGAPATSLVPNDSNGGASRLVRRPNVHTQEGPERGSRAPPVFYGANVWGLEAPGRRRGRSQRCHDRHDPSETRNQLHECSSFASACRGCRGAAPAATHSEAGKELRHISHMVIFEAPMFLRPRLRVAYSIDPH